MGVLGRYSPGKCTGVDLRRVEGRPDLAHVSTFYAERHNLTMRRITRLMNAFSKKAENYTHALALCFTFYDFMRQHRTLQCSPAMAVSLSTTLWSMEDAIALIDAAAEPAKVHGSYKLLVFKTRPVQSIQTKSA